MMERRETGQMAVMSEKGVSERLLFFQVRFEEIGNHFHEDTERVFSKNGFGGSEGERIEKGKPRENTSEGA